MSDYKQGNTVSETNPEEPNNVAVEVSAGCSNDVSKHIITRMYASFSWNFNYIKMFIARLGKDIYHSLLTYINSERVLPRHIAQLQEVHKNDRSLRQRSSIHSGEDVGIQCTFSPCLQDKEATVAKVKYDKITEHSNVQLKTLASECIIKNYEYVHYLLPGYFDVPSTSKGQKNIFALPQLDESTFDEEYQMYDVNLQSDSDIDFDERDIDNQSIVISYLRNRNLIDNTEGALSTSGKKFSLISCVPKMETIAEGETKSEEPTERVDEDNDQK